MEKEPTAVQRRGVLRRLAGVGGALAALAIIASACGSSPNAGVASLGNSSTTTTAAPSANSGSSQNGASPTKGAGQSTLGFGGVTEKFSQCMRSHGVPSFPDPNSQGQVQFSGVDPQSASFAAAKRACAKYAPNGGKGPTAAQQQQALAQALNYSKCMRNHGVKDFPDPQGSGSGGGIGISIHGGASSDLNPNNPTFQAAQKACQSLMPGRAGGAPSSATKAG
jgi:hypothetical protein